MLFYYNKRSFEPFVLRCVLCCPVTISILFNILCVWTLLQNVSSQLFRVFVCFLFVSCLLMFWRGCVCLFVAF